MLPKTAWDTATLNLVRRDNRVKEGENLTLRSAGVGLTTKYYTQSFVGLVTCCWEPLPGSIRSVCK